MDPPPEDVYDEEAYALMIAILYAFKFFYHYDKMNAAVHCAPVKFSPITFRLAKVAHHVDECAEVLSHVGLYEQDPGR